MSVYTWLVVLILLAALLMRGNVKGNRKYIFVAFVLLFCVMGLRDVYTIGNDSTSSYLHNFQGMEDAQWDELGGRGEDNKNMGFSYLMKVGYVITDGDYQLFIALLSIFVLASFMHFIRKYSPSPMQSVLYFLGLMFYTFLFDALKQSIAMAILLFAFDAIIDRKPIKFIILVFLASWFHFPALVFIPAYWVGNIKLGRSYVFVLAGLLLITYLFRDQLLDIMTDAYDTTIYDNGMRFLANKVIVMLVIVAAALIIRPPVRDDNIYRTLLQLIGIAVVLQTFASYNNTFTRLADYYFQLSIVFLPLVFEKFDVKRSYFSPKADEMIKTVAPVVFCSFAIWRFLSNVNADELLSPYIFFFQSTIQ